MARSTITGLVVDSDNVPNFKRDSDEAYVNDNRADNRWNELELHPNKVSIRSWNQGIDFLGYVLRPNATTLRTKTKRRMLPRVNGNNVNSYLSICAHANEFELSQIVKLLAWDKQE